MLELVYRHSCPLCGGRASARELIEYGCCTTCSSNRVSSIEEYALELWRREVGELVKLFKDAIEHEPWSLQLHWIKRLLSNESFAMIAPTGIGKSTLLAIYALFRAYFYGWKVYILTPTREIAKQFFDRMKFFAEKLEQKGYYGIARIRVLFYDSASRSSKELKEEIKQGNFDILITSASFLSRNYDLVSINRIDLVIADDLDALMRNSRNIDRILKLLGFTDEEIELASKLVKLKQNLLVAKLSSSQEKLESLRLEVLELEAKLRNRVSMIRAQLVVASATGRVKGLKPLIMKELLGFEGGALFEYWRNVEDFYTSIDKLHTYLPKIVKYLKSGIVFVSQGIDKSIVKKLKEILESQGVRVAIAKSGTKAVDKFRRGEIDIIIGTASYYGILVRGLDEPLRVRFTVFVGVPRVARELRQSLNNVRFLYIALKELRSRGIDVREYMTKLVEIIQKSTPAMLVAYSKWMKDPSSVPEAFRDRIEILLSIAEYVYRMLLEVLKRERVLVIGNTALIVMKNNKAYVLRADPYTYIQASGRSSRLLNGSKTFGVSIVFEEHIELVHMLEARLRRFVSEFKFKQFDDSYLSILAEKIELSRYGEVKSKDIRGAIRTTLIIVESPTKAKTIASMFGKPAKRIVGESIVYETVIPVDNDRVYVASIAASLGHITDLVTDEGIYGVRCRGHRYEPVYDFITRCRACNSQHVGVYESCPYCGSNNVYTSFRTFNALKKLALDVDEVFIGTDPDTEGEKIAFDLWVLLSPYNRNIKRIEFHEVTKRALLEALRNPRAVDMRRVEAQIARRIADRWIGFEVSLWLQKVFDKPWLGAGRVQSPVLLWIVDRYREYRDSIGYKLILDIYGYRVRIFIGRDAEHRELAEELAKKALDEGLEVVHVDTELREIPPPPPFTTDALLYEAGRVYGYSASKTMTIAQALFEAGLITYHRTDSTRVSSIGVTIAREALERLGLQHLFTPRTWGIDSKAEDAHEAIRPTSPLDAEGVREAIIRGDLGFVTRIGEAHIKLYDLIYRRFLASQMKSAVIRYIKARLRIENLEVEIEAPIEIVDPGFTAVYPIKVYHELSQLLKQKRVKPVNAMVKRSAQIRLYTTADLVKLLKERGIGRPSTYAKAIDNNVRHGYVILSKKRKAAIPTKLGIAVSEVLRDKFLPLIGEHVTRELEEVMDSIERGDKHLDEFLVELRMKIDDVMAYAEARSVEAIATYIDDAI